MIFRQLFDCESSTYTYLLADAGTREAVLIDPVLDQVERDIQLLSELELRLKYTLETHVHADHVTGSGMLRQRLGSQSAVCVRGRAECADIQVEHGCVLRFGDQRLEVRATPGHTEGCVTYVTADRRMAFTGDALLIRGCGRTDFQNGDSATLYRSVHEQLFSLPDECLVYPGHDYKGRTVSTVGEERRHNPRLGAGRTVEEFVAIMAGLNLAYPRQIDVALPANTRCGMPASVLVGGEPAPERGWAPVARVEGVPEVPAEWAATADVRRIDVREPAEVAERPLAGAESVPLGELAAAAAGWDREAPLVLICASGKRSGAAAQQLEGMGFKRVASLAGGMRAWRP